MPGQGSNLHPGTAETLQISLSHSGNFSKNIKNNLAYDPVIPLLGIHSREMKTGYQRDKYTLMLIAALFLIVKIWKQSKCLAMDEQGKSTLKCVATIPAQEPPFSYQTFSDNMSLLPFCSFSCCSSKLSPKMIPERCLFVLLLRATLKAWKFPG